MVNRLGKIVHWSGLLLSVLAFLYLPSFGVIEISIGLLPLLISWVIQYFLTGNTRLFPW